MTKWGLSLVIIVFLVYANALDGGFVYDDEFLIQKNVIVQNALKQPELFGVILKTSTTFGSGGTDSFYRPVQIVAYSLIAGLFGLEPLYFHILNVALHAMNALLVFFLLVGIFRIRMGEMAGLWAFLAALLWAVHPIHTEAVAYNSATADPLHFTFGLLFIFLSMRAAFYWKVLGILFLILSFATKEASVTFPGLLFAALFVRAALSENPRPFVSAFRESVLPLSLALIYTGLRGTLLDFDNSFQFYDGDNVYTSSLLNRLLTGLAAISLYMKLWFWPDHLQIDRSFPVFVSFEWPVVTGLIISLASLLPFIFYVRGRMRQARGYGRRIAISPIFCFFALWFWAYHSLHMGVAVPLNSFFLEHWMYIPGVALSGAMVYGLWILVSKQRAVYGGAMIFLLAASVALGARTHEQNKIWRGPIPLYTHILKGSPDIARVHNNLAMAYSDLGDYASAEKHYRESVRISDVYPQVRHNLGLLYLRQGRVDHGIVELEKALEINPKFFQSAAYLAEAWRAKGDLEKSQKYVEIYQRNVPKF